MECWKLFVEGLRAMPTSGLAYKTPSSLLHGMSARCQFEEVLDPLQSRFSRCCPSHTQTTLSAVNKLPCSTLTHAAPVNHHHRCPAHANCEFMSVYHHHHHNMLIRFRLWFNRIINLAGPGLIHPQSAELVPSANRDRGWLAFHWMKDHIWWEMRGIRAPVCAPVMCFNWLANHLPNYAPKTQ